MSSEPHNSDWAPRFIRKSYPVGSPAKASHPTASRQPTVEISELRFHTRRGSRVDHRLTGRTRHKPGLLSNAHKSLFKVTLPRGLTMTENTFWGLLEKARNCGATSACPCCLTRCLRQLSDQDVSDFGLMLYEKICELNTWQLWGAGQVIAGEMSGDSFHYFRAWIVGVGEQAFETAGKDPDSLGQFLDRNKDPIDVDNESLEYVAVQLLQERGFNADPRERCSSGADDKPRGIPFNLLTLVADYPKLATLRLQGPIRTSDTAVGSGLPNLKPMPVPQGHLVRGDSR